MNLRFCKSANEICKCAIGQRGVQHVVALTVSRLTIWDGFCGRACPGSALQSLVHVEMFFVMSDHVPPHRLVRLSPLCVAPQDSDVLELSGRADAHCTCKVLRSWDAHHLHGPTPVQFCTHQTTRHTTSSLENVRYCKGATYVADAALRPSGRSVEYSIAQTYPASFADVCRVSVSTPQLRGMLKQKSRFSVSLFPRLTHC